MPPVDVDVVLVAEEAPVVLLRPARILVLLPAFRGFLRPRIGRRARLHLRVLILRVVLPGRGDDGRIDDLPAARKVALCFEVLGETLEQLVNKVRLDQGFAEQPDGGAKWIFLAISSAP